MPLLPLFIIFKSLEEYIFPFSTIPPFVPECDNVIDPLSVFITALSPI